MLALSVNLSHHYCSYGNDNPSLIFLHDRIQFYEFAIMGLSIIDELCKLFAYCINCMETRQSHVAIQISGSWTRVYAENLNGMLFCSNSIAITPIMAFWAALLAT